MFVLLCYCNHIQLQFHCGIVSLSLINEENCRLSKILYDYYVNWSSDIWIFNIPETITEDIPFLHKIAIKLDVRTEANTEKAIWRISSLALLSSLLMTCSSLSISNSESSTFPINAFKICLLNSHFPFFEPNCDYQIMQWYTMVIIATYIM